jgi:uncharacterized protein YbjT (DUF2867 family)
MELVTGATGYVGSRLLRRLSADGRTVRALARRPERVEDLPGVEALRGDLLEEATLEAALEGCHTAYYLVHSMEASAANGSGGDFAGRDRQAAETFGRAAAAAGLERIVYLGGIAPAGRRSEHLRSRLEVEDLLFSAVPDSTALRASIVIGAGSSSFRLLVRLVERLRVLPLPRWRNNRTQPIDERDVIEYLAQTPSVPAAAGRALDICGPDRVTFAELVNEIAAGIGVGRMPLGLPTTMTPPASAVVAAVTGQPIELVRPLMESLESDVLPRDPHEAAEMYGLRPRSLARAVDHALAEWEALEPLGAR